MSLGYHLSVYRQLPPNPMPFRDVENCPVRIRHSIQSYDSVSEYPSGVYCDDILDMLGDG